MTDSNLDIIRTQEDLINAVSVLYFNLMEIERIYYDMFINPTPMDVEFQRYDDAGVLERILLPNRAKDATPIATGDGNPNNKQAANPGALYLDVSSLNLYFKSSGTDNQGWVLLYSVANLDIEQFLRPNGDGSKLTNLNVNNVTAGILPVERGGTGNGGTLSGIVKAQGTSEFTVARDGVDYLGPNSFTGLICYYPVDPEATVGSSSLKKLDKWLICNGASYDPQDYPNLYARIGYTYGSVTEGGVTKFKVPNLMGYYVKCWNGSPTAFNSITDAVVGSHRHGVNITSGDQNTDHTHSRGSQEIIGYIPASESVFKPGEGWGYTTDALKAKFKAFRKEKSNIVSGVTQNDKFDQDLWNFKASRSWTGSSSKQSANHQHVVSGNTKYNDNTTGVENEVKNYQLVPVIKY